MKYNSGLEHLLITVQSMEVHFLLKLKCLNLQFQMLTLINLLPFMEEIFTSFMDTSLNYKDQKKKFQKHWLEALFIFYQKNEKVFIIDTIITSTIVKIRK